MKDVGMEALGMDDFRLAYISDAYRKEIEYDRDKIRIASLDIEVTAPEFPDPREAKYAIDAITHYDSVEDKFFVYDLVEGGLDEWVASKVDTENEISEEDLKKIVYRSFQTEKSLMSAYIKDWKERTPVIVTGWNSNKFDIAYIITRYLNIFGQNVVRHFIRSGKVTAKTTTDHYGNEQLGYEIYGVAQMDGMDLYKNSVSPRNRLTLWARSLSSKRVKTKLITKVLCLNCVKRITRNTSRITSLTLSACWISTVNATLSNWFCL